MKRELFFILSCLSVMISCFEVASAETKKANLEILVNNGDAFFAPVVDMHQDLLQPKVGNGSVADTNQWPATVVTEAGGLGKCTATFIGPEVLLTAAHCVGQGSKAIITKWETTGICHRQADWSLANMSPDWALCRMSAVDRPGLFFERLDLNGNALQIGTKLTLAGFGCINLDTQEQETPARLRVGPTIVEKLPNPEASWANWIVTAPATHGGESFVCPGDSGGAVYWQRADGGRSIVAVVSAVGADKNKSDYKSSYLSATSVPALKSFVEQWLKDQKVLSSTKPSICGVTVGAQKCRPTPP
jgi:hypothetical protein